MTSSPSDLNGLRVLVVEDNLLLAEVICDVLDSYGCEVIGPVADLGKGLELARDAALDGALLDINLAGEPSFPIAAALAKRTIPYLFLTGYGDKRRIPVEHRSVERIAKPVDPAALSAAIAEQFRAPPLN